MKKIKCIIIGAGEAGRELYREIKNHSNKFYGVVGFLDDNEKRLQGNVAGVRVLGKTDELARFIDEYKLEEVFIAIPSAQGSLIRKIIQNCERKKVTFRIVPRLLEIIEGKVKLSGVREIETQDLIGRAIVKSDQEAFKNYFRNKTILVTGAAGSIGSELCRQIVQFNPKRLIALDFFESGLYDLNLELSGITDKCNYLCVLGNIFDYRNLRKIMNQYRPEIVFHAAAYKHVPLMQMYPAEAIKNNVFGTKNVAQAARLSGVKKFVNISTDKAVDPSSVMGATKLLGEQIVKTLNKKGKTKFCSVRFGNVLGSQGSVVPTFKKQILRGGPVTVTDKKMTRYFMSIPESVQLVLTAVLLIKNGGEIFMLDMGEKVKIDELARLMIRLAGFVPEVDIKIKYTGVRPGEKINEMLFGQDETLEKTKNDKIFIVGQNYEDSNIDDVLKDLSSALGDEDGRKIFSILRKVAPNLKMSNNY